MATAKKRVKSVPTTEKPPKFKKIRKWVRTEEVVVPGGRLRLTKKLSPSASAFVERSLRAILNVASTEREDQLTAAMGAPTDVGVVARVLSASAAIGVAAELDPLASLIAKGIEDKQTLIRDAGGLLSSEQVARVLAVTRQAVYKQRRDKKLLSVPHGGEEKFPAIQFTKDGQAIPGLSNVLKAIGLVGAWGTLDFLLAPDDEIGGLSPIEMLKKHPEKLDEVVRLASIQGEQGAG
jgi:hypothetical protein